nr:MAG: hypothetical protein [Bacteriophage sp.]
MKNNETFQTTQHLDKLVTNLGLQIQELFSLDLEETLDLEEILDYSNNLMNLLVNAYVENQCLALSAMISKQDGFAIYSFLFQTPDTSNGAADALVNFAMNFTDGEANIKSINRISSNIMQITFTV